MIDESQLRRRFLEDDVPHRLGNLASTLNRLASFVSLGRPGESVLNVLDEAHRFVHWTRGDATDDTAHKLEELARVLKSWRTAWPEVISDPQAASRLAGEARAWSNQVLELSGLLPRDP